MSGTFNRAATPSWHGLSARVGSGGQTEAREQAARHTRAESPCHGRIRSRRRGRSRTGLGLVELLISLAIAATLLTAVAVAVDASFAAYAANQTESDLMQRSRVALHRMTSTMRETKLHAPAGAALAADFAAGEVVDSPTVVMYDNAGVETEYAFDAAAGTVSVVRTDGANPAKTYLLLDGVSSFRVKMEPMRSATSVKTGGGYDLLKRATFYLTVASTGRTNLAGDRSGAMTVTLTASVMPRRNAW